MTFLNYFLDITIASNLKNHLLLNYYHIDMDVENEKDAIVGPALNLKTLILFNRINHDFKKLCHMNVDFSLMILYGMWDTHIGHTGEYICEHHRNLIFFFGESRQSL
jgi:hypothetical protein